MATERDYLTREEKHAALCLLSLDEAEWAELFDLDHSQQWPLPLAEMQRAVDRLSDEEWARVADYCRGVR
ncbi:MAG: hypothetical protein ACLPR9_04565 [Acidimicrobiales bacterium]|jgi:hypothetical protein